jgi:hypothetical protein
VREDHRDFGWVLARNKSKADLVERQGLVMEDLPDPMMSGRLPSARVGRAREI